MGRPSHTRLRVAIVVLAVVWAASFAVPLLPFFPTVLVGGGLTGLFGLWIRRSALAPLPGLRLTPRSAALAIAVAGGHFVVGRFLFDAASGLVPGIATTAQEIYTRTAQVALPWRMLLAGAVTAPLEELFWRGAAHPVVTHGEPRRRRIVASAAIYAIFHLVTLQPALVLAALLGGLVWGWLLEREGSVAVPMLAHGLWTGLMVAFPPLPSVV